jgi:predicted acyltransferase
MEGNFASYLDTLIMPGKLYRIIHDPEGLVSTIPAISTALLGIFTGNLLKNTSIEKNKNSALRLVLIGIILVVLAQIWNLVFPINKNLWTSSFTLQCGGISMILMAIFYYVIDVLGYKKWAFFFKVIGMNSILIYMSVVFINWSNTTSSLFQWLGQIVGEPYDVVVLLFCSLAVQWIFLYFLYKKELFLRV